MSDTQKQVMGFVLVWVRSKKTPVPRQEIIYEMSKMGIGEFTVTNAIDTLIKNGFIRKAQMRTKKASYVQLRSF